MKNEKEIEIEYNLRCPKCKSNIVRKFKIDKTISPFDMIEMSFMEKCPTCQNVDDFPITEIYEEGK